MINGDAIVRNTQTTKKVIPVLLAFALLSTSGSAAAGWLDKLKEMVSSDDEK